MLVFSFLLIPVISTAISSHKTYTLHYSAETLFGGVRSHRVTQGEDPMPRAKEADTVFVSDFPLTR